MKDSDFYGGASPVHPGSGMGIEVPAETNAGLNPGKRPAHFWLILVGLLVLARVFYEAAGE